VCNRVTDNRVSDNWLKLRTHKKGFILAIARKGNRGKIHIKTTGKRQKVKVDYFLNLINYYFN